MEIKIFQGLKGMDIKVQTKAGWFYRGKLLEVNENSFLIRDVRSGEVWLDPQIIVSVEECLL